MLNRKISRFRLGLVSKGSPSFIKTSCRYFLQGIPVLSIFALLGILNVSIISLGNQTETASADEVIGDTNTASITISGAGSTEQVEAGFSKVTYRSHNVRVQANNIKAYTLNISGPSTLVTRNKDGSSVANATTITSAGGATGAEMNTNSSNDNTWGYGYSTDTAAANDGLTYVAPTPTGSLINIGNMSEYSLERLFKLTFAIKFSEDAVPGRYYGDVVLSFITTPRELVNYSLTYNANNGSNPPAAQTDSLYEDKTMFTISSTIPTRTNYRFLGWADVANATVAQYKAGDQITLTNASPTKTLYAVWQQLSTSFPSSLTTMQGMTSEICANVVIGASKTLTDTRDNSTYAIRKHQDGNCWMTQNLKISGSRTLDSSTSDLPSGITYSMPASSPSGFVSSQLDGNNLYVHSSYGGFYSWYAATAGTGAGMSSGIASGSICPRGWTLPPASGQGSYAGLFSAIGVTASDANTVLVNTPYSFVKSGYMLSGTLKANGSEANYWTSTAGVTGGDLSAYFMSFMIPNYLQTGSTGSVSYRYYGFSVRCVAR